MTARQAEAPEQRRILAVLVISQVLSGAGLAAGITVGALLAEDLLGSAGPAGLPTALHTAGAALGAVAIGRLSQRLGRRPGLALGHATAAAGSLGVVAAASARSAALLFTALFVYGAGTATNLLARYAGADLAAPARRGRAVSTILLATTFGAVVGPNLAGVTGEVAHAWGLHRLTGPFLLAAASYAAAGVVLALLLRPDPLLRARELTPQGPPEPAAARTLTPGVVTGTAVMITGQLVMVAVMAMTPVHMTGHGHGTQAAGLVIAVHVAAMFLPSPLSGLLVDRIGSLRVAAASGVVLAAAGLLAALAPPDRVPALAVALALLGLGWNLSLVSGTAIVTDAVPLTARASVQGLADVGMAIAGSTGGLLSGLVVATGGYPALAAGGAVLALATLPIAVAASQPRRR
ncbi:MULTISPECIES: MFS transporter [Streptomyces]|uniref:MFS transporter n=1 Tax=Streptomyces luteosporeus TaxID=173856 RepID=A0ABN3U2H8_9ACTN